MEKTISAALQLPDLLLVRKILDGERALFELIIRRYNQTLFRIGMSILGNDTETEDAMQNTYIKAYENLDKFENRSTFSTWLTRIMINEALARKKHQRRPIISISTTEEQQTPAHMLMNKELSSLLENAISQLPEKYRLVFVLREIEEMSVKETSEALDIEETNVKVRLNRAKTMLKTQLKDHMKDHAYAFHLFRCDRMVSNVWAQLNLRETRR